MPHLAPSTWAAEWPAWVWPYRSIQPPSMLATAIWARGSTSPGCSTARGSHCTTQRMFASLIWSVSRFASVEVYDSTEWASASMPVEAVSPAGSPTVSSGSRIM